MRKVLFVGLAIVLTCAFAVLAQAESAAKLDSRVQHAIEVLKEIKNADSVLEKAEGLLVFPKIVKGGLVFGGEYGEGALIVDGQTKGYYNTAGGSFGLQVGVQKKSLIIAFMDKGALTKFENSSGWKIGTDASVAAIKVGVDGSVDTAKSNQPIVAFVFGQKGLMGNLTLEGAKVTKIRKY